MTTGTEEQPEEQTADQPVATLAAAPPAYTPTDAEILQFVYAGRQYLTAVWNDITTLHEWTKSFEVRGGAPVYGDDALEIVYLSNALQTLLDDANRATIARLRTDI